MSLTTQYSTATYKRRIAVIKSQSIVEIRFSGQEIGEICSVNPQVCLTSCESSSGRVNYGGRIVCTVVYTDEGGKLCRIQKGAEFSHYADDEVLAPAHNTLCALKCERAGVKREGSSYLIAVVVSAEISVFASAERNYLSGVEGAVVNRENQKLFSAVTFTGEGEVEDDFDCNCEDVLSPSAEALVLDCNCRAGAVEISGEIYLSLLAVRGSSPVCLERIIPFRCEVACDDALLAVKAVCRAEVKEISVNARINEEKGKCNVELNCQLGFVGQYYEEEEVSLVSDAFSKENQLQLGFAEETAFPCNEIRVYSERVTGLCSVKAKLDYTCALLAPAVPKVEFARSDNGIEGSVTTILLYSQSGEIHSTEVNLPFTVTLSGMGDNIHEISVAVCGVNLRQRDEGKCEAEAVLKIAVFDCEKKTARYVCEAVEGESIKSSDSALSVYIPSAGDGLWETAKKLLQSPEEIQTTNPELIFPLTGKERILIYRPKTV